MKYVISFLLAVLVFIGCAGPQKIRVTGEEKIVERSAKKRPEWILKPYYEKGNMLYYSGGVTGKGNYELALRQAKGEAIKNITEGIQVKVRTEFSEATRGTNISEDDLGSFVEDALGMVTENLNIQGIIPKTQYYEKVEKTTATGVKYLWNCYMLLTIEKSDYLQARNLALNGLVDKAKRERDKKAEEAATLLMERLIK